MPMAGVRAFVWKFTPLVVAGVLVLALPIEGSAGSSLAPLNLVNSRGKLCVSTRLNGGFSKDITETITSGIPATFSYEIEVWRQRRRWKDKFMDSKVLDRVVTFNSLRGEFKVVQKGSSGSWKRKSKHLQEVKNWVTLVDTLPLVKLSTLDPSNEYYVRVRVIVTSDESHSFLKKYALYFSPFKKEKTAWEKSKPFSPEDLATSRASVPSSAPPATSP
ncbi:MAG: DUF4390 domain-containing protein [bacterium]|nr:DUF4390 domain-containing protein [bacterium]